ncbi:MAG TPA: imidazole glycerol phosphate synthase subunit HisH, partial [Cellvibrionaceae bacterium]|nr:imidazole glycerol phosphate synthase subunit HisH [Cellvibrionaceae bacterium]
MADAADSISPNILIGIIDLGIGNINSVEKALKSLGAQVLVAADFAALEQASHYILPGVGSFAAASQALIEKGGAVALNNLVGNKPVLGICVGMQLFAKSGQEHGHNPGLNWVEAEVCLMPTQLPLPHVGWNDITPLNDCPLFINMPPQPCFYFTHSYAFMDVPVNQVGAYCTYGSRFVAAVQSERRYAVQFHPEKSQQLGLLLLSN